MLGLVQAMGFEWAWICVLVFALQCVAVHVSRRAAGAMAIGCWAWLLVNFRVRLDWSGMNLADMVFFPHAMETWGPVALLWLLIPVPLWLLWARARDHGLRWSSLRSPLVVHALVAAATAAALALRWVEHPVGTAFVISWFGASPQGWQLISYLASCVVFVGYALAVVMHLENQWSSSFGTVAMRYGSLRRWWWALLRGWLVLALPLPAAVCVLWVVAHLWAAGPTTWTVDGWPVMVAVFQMLVNGVLQLWLCVLVAVCGRWIWGGAAGAAVALGAFVALGLAGTWWLPSHLNDVGMAPTWASAVRNSSVLAGWLIVSVAGTWLGLGSRHLRERNMQ